MCWLAAFGDINQVRHLGFTVPDQPRQRLSGVSRRCLAKKAASLRPRADQDEVVFATTTALRALGRWVVALDEEAKELDKLLCELVAKTAPELAALYGVEPDTAAVLSFGGARPGSTPRLLGSAP